MRNPATNQQLELTWVEVHDADGRTRMEAQWTLAPAATHASTPHAA